MKEFVNKKEKSSPQTFSISNFIKKDNKCQVTEKLEPICYQIHDYLKENAAGYENRKSAKEIMAIFDIEKDDVLRSYIRKIRDSEILHKPICSKAGAGGMNGYWIATDPEEIIKSAKSLERRGWDMIKRAKRMKRKALLNNQMKLKFTKYEKDKIESVINNG